MKKFQKAIAALTMGATLLAATPVAVAATVSTGFTRSTGGGAAPIIKVKWEMYSTKDTTTYLAQDELPAIGAQFMPSGEYGKSTKYTVCAVATDPDGVSDINAVYADIFFPDAIYLGDNHESNRLGCGLPHEDENLLTKLPKAEGIELFCNRVKNNNNNLPKFHTGYDYNEICAPDGELQKETAYVYCADKELSYEDPASNDYEVWVLAQDKAGLDSNILENHFEYLPVTAFEVDFTSVSYGDVKLNTHKIINGDLTWNDAGDPTKNKPTVRNIGNTRLQMSVWQDDMGLGKTDAKWNVKWDARVGSSASHILYDPEVTTWLLDELDLSETDEMDFSIEVSKFPPSTGPQYTGNMVLGAQSRDHLSCTI